jgi:hypothetical protein
MLTIAQIPYSISIGIRLIHVRRDWAVIVTILGSTACAAIVSSRSAEVPIIEDAIPIRVKAISVTDLNRVLAIIYAAHENVTMVVRLS